MVFQTHERERAQERTTWHRLCCGSIVPPNPSNHREGEKVQKHWFINHTCVYAIVVAHMMYNNTVCLCRVFRNCSAAQGRHRLECQPGRLCPGRMICYCIVYASAMRIHARAACLCLFLHIHTHATCLHGFARGRIWCVICCSNKRRCPAVAGNKRSARRCFTLRTVPCVVYVCAAYSRKHLMTLASVTKRKRMKATRAQWWLQEMYDGRQFIRWSSGHRAVWWLC